MVLKIIRREERGCGYRNERGFYLVCSALVDFCHRLPLDIPTCVCCGQYKIPYGIRGIAFINPMKVFGKCEIPTGTSGENVITWVDSDGHYHSATRTQPHPVVTTPCTKCPATCPACNPPDRGWYMSAGEEHYSMKSFTAEAVFMGVSKKVRYIPEGMQKGDYLFVGYRKAVYDCAKDEWLPQVFCVAPITAFEKVVSRERLKSEEGKKYLKELEEKGIDAVIEYDDTNQVADIAVEALNAGFEPQVGKYEVP